MNTRMGSIDLTSELLLEVFDSPVSFHRCLVPITGGVISALMLSQAIWTTQSLEPSADGWFIRSQEQESARRALRRSGLLEERRGGLPARLWFRVCPDAVWCALQANAQAANQYDDAGVPP